MWLATKHGFYSVVCGTQETPNMIFPDRSVIQIRARDKQHLEELIRRFPGILGTLEIIHTEHADYEFRIIADPRQWRNLLLGLADELDYTNFKQEVQKRRPWDKNYLHFLHAVWSAGVSWISNPRRFNQ